MDGTLGCVIGASPAAQNPGGSRMRSLPFVRVRLPRGVSAEIVKLFVTAGLDTFSESRLGELGSTHDMPVLKFGVAPSVKGYSGKAFTSVVLVRALGERDSMLSSTGFASAE